MLTLVKDGCFIYEANKWKNKTRRNGVDEEENRMETEVLSIHFISTLPSFCTNDFGSIWKGILKKVDVVKLCFKFIVRLVLYAGKWKLVCLRCYGMCLLCIYYDMCNRQDLERFIYTKFTWILYIFLKS